MIAAMIKTSDQLIITFDTGQTYDINQTHSLFEQIVEQTRLQNWDKVHELCDAAIAIKNQLTSFDGNNNTVRIENNVVYLNDEPLENELTRRMIEMLHQNFDIEPLMKFLCNLQNNPSKTAVSELYQFLEHGRLPITPDGHFIAYKRVRNDYTDCYTGTEDNSIGRTLSMDRNKVDDNRNNTCSTGYHFCSRQYLPHFGNSSGNRTMMVKINPRDVVSIPADYNNTKGRCCKYHVIGELEHRQEHELETHCVLNQSDVEQVSIKSASTPTIGQFDSNGDLVRQYTSSDHAQVSTGIDKHAINRVLRGDRKTTGGYIWKYIL